MIRCIVEMYGFALEVSGRNEMEVVLADGARLGDVIAELRQKAPELEGKVINPGTNTLVEHCVFNIEGKFYFENEDVEIKDGGRIRLLTLATGG
ncbi:MoaD/ThiS family protein [Chloroflexota bacterium]